MPYALPFITLFILFVAAAGALDTSTESFLRDINLDRIRSGGIPPEAFNQVSEYAAGVAYAGSPHMLAVQVLIWDKQFMGLVQSLAKDYCAVNSPDKSMEEGVRGLYKDVEREASRDELCISATRFQLMYVASVALEIRWKELNPGAGLGKVM